jgi:glutamine amidotransferase
VETALRSLGADFHISDRPEELRSVDKLVFPGVGDAGAAMRTLRQYHLDELILEFAKSGRPLLGICLGSQIVLRSSEERETECLGLVLGSVRRFPRDGALKVPHMGWNTVRPVNGSPLFHGIPAEASFYFVHSYYPEPEARDAVMAETDYGITFASGVARDNVWAVQFHPEKSGTWGLQLLSNFLTRS